MQALFMLFFMKQEKRSDCPFSCSLDILGDKWTLLIIRDMVFSGKNTYSEFLKSPEGIATNILASKLLQLEENGIIEKLEHPDSKAKYLYKLTPKGIGLIPVLAEIYLWAEQHHAIPDEVKIKMEALKEDKEAAIKSLTERIEKI